MIKIALTGASYGGKTTVANELIKILLGRTYVIPDSIAQVVPSLWKSEGGVEKANLWIRENSEEFIDKVIDTYEAALEHIVEEDYAFLVFDRPLTDLHIYCIGYGIPESKRLKRLLEQEGNKYDAVFSFSPLRDPPQKESPEKKKQYSDYLVEKRICDAAYRNFAYETVDVLPMPKRSIKESTKARATYIVDFLLDDDVELTTIATASRQITMEEYAYYVAMSMAKERPGQSFFHYLTKCSDERKNERDYETPTEERSLLALDKHKNPIGGITYYNADVQGMDSDLKLVALGDLWVKPHKKSGGTAGKLITLAMDFIESEKYNLVFGATSALDLYQKFIPGIRRMEGVFDPLTQDSARGKEKVMAKVIIPFDGHHTVGDYEHLYAGKGSTFIW